MTAFSRAAKKANKVGAKVAEWAHIERLLTTVCAFSPVLMVWIDPDPLRDSISAYFSMTANQWFYVPLAIGAMLFLVNGITKRNHWYNWVLGIALVGVLMFNTRDFAGIHMVFAITFFAGNAAVIIWWTDVPAQYRYGFAAALGIAAMITAATGSLTIWLAEFISLVIIAIHFFLNSVDNWTWYNALPKGAEPWRRANPRPVPSPE